MSRNNYPEELKMASEAIEPAIEYMLGRWFAQSEHIRKTYGTHSVYFVDHVDRWWFGMRALSKLTVATQDTIHASLMVSTCMRITSNYIEEHLGFSPLSIKEVGPMPRSFRGECKFEIDFSCLVAGAHKFADQKRAEGMTAKDAAAELGKMLKSDTGDVS